MSTTERIETENATIESTHLGCEDHGILSAYLNLKYDGGGQSFGGYSLDAPDNTRKDFRRVGTAYGMEFIRRIMETVGVGKWEDLKGKHIRSRHTHSKIHAIGHIIEDKWFSPDTDLEEFKSPTP